MTRASSCALFLLAGCVISPLPAPPTSPAPTPAPPAKVTLPAPVWPNACVEDWYAEAQLPPCVEGWISDLTAQQSKIAKKSRGAK